jgi:chromosome segregation ATPase
MSEAPERIWAFPIKDWFRGGCSTHKIIERKYARDVEYIRADIHEARIKELEARIKELEAQLAEVQKKIGALDAFIDLLTNATGHG